MKPPHQEGVSTDNVLAALAQASKSGRNRGSNTTTTMAAMTTDVTTSTNDHAWTDDLTTPTTSEQPLPEHPSEASEFDRFWHPYDSGALHRSFKSGPFSFS